MIPTPADRHLAATFVDTFADPNAGVTVAQYINAGLEPAADDQEWEFAVLLVAVARRAGWTPPAT